MIISRQEAESILVALTGGAVPAHGNTLIWDDQAGYRWGSQSIFDEPITEIDIPAGEDDAIEIDWANIINTPTTLAGYGITDAYTKDEIDEMFDDLTFADIDGQVDWPTQIDFTVSSIGDLTTKSAGDLSSGNLAYARLPTGGGTWNLGGELTFSGGTLFNNQPVAIVLGHTASVNWDNKSSRFQLHGTSDSNSGQVFTRTSDTAQGGFFVFGKARGTTIGTFTSVQTGDALGTIIFVGADGTDGDTRGAILLARAVGTIAANRIPTNLEFSTSAGVSDNDIAVKMTLWGSGILLVGATNITPISTHGRGLEVSKLTGAATIEPAYVRIRTTTSVNGWDLTNPWGMVDFYSDDGNAPGASSRARIGATAESTTGALTYLAFSISDASGLAEAWRITSAKVWQAPGAATIQTATGILTIATAAGDGDIIFSPHGTGLAKFLKAAVPNTNDLVALGSATLSWSDLFLASGAIINFGNGELTLTSAANSLTIAGGDLLFSADNALDIGASGATRPRRVYIGTGLQIGARPDYTVTNPTTNRSLDVTGATLGQLAQVVGTIIQDFIDREVFQ